jgi:hypothetical protein
MVTSAPNERHTLANSTPITPPPSTTARGGTRSSVSAWSEVITRSPSMSRPGRDLEYEPRGEHEVLADVALAVHLDGGRPDQPARTLDQGHLARLGEALQALVETADNPVLVRIHAGHVDAQQFRLDAELG